MKHSSVLVKCMWVALTRGGLWGRVDADEG